MSWFEPLTAQVMPMAHPKAAIPTRMRPTQARIDAFSADDSAGDGSMDTVWRSAGLAKPCR